MTTTPSGKQEVFLKETETAQMHPLVDIGINLTHKAFRKHWKEVVQRAIDARVETLLLTGTSLRSSRECLALARDWWEETSGRNLYCTLGVHPHDAKTFVHSNEQTLNEMRQLLRENKEYVVAIGECGLDFNRNFSSRKDQLNAFRAQVELACEVQLPLFVHEREAHEDLLRVLDEVTTSHILPPVVVHCFTGTWSEAEAYLERGFYIGFTGTICKKERGAPLREFLPRIPLDRLMIETDAPFMGFLKGRRSSEPAHVVGVAKQVSETTGKSFEEVCQTTTQNARKFFRITIESS